MFIQELARKIYPPILNYKLPPAPELVYLFIRWIDSLAQKDNV